MQAHSTDPEVFIRSVATRGALGGLSRSAMDIVRILDAWGADVVIVETVGVGQDELEITRSADTTLIVMAPGLGDDVQAIKAGLLECADAFTVNKADRDGADATVRDLELMIALGGEVVRAGVHSRGHSAGTLDVTKQVVRHDKDKWVPPIVRTVATRNEGVVDLLAKLGAHRKWLLETDAGKARRYERLCDAMRTELRGALFDAAVSDLGDQIEQVALSVARRETDPYTASERLVAAFRGR
jgi:LAO/AO transport system kinase